MVTNTLKKRFDSTKLSQTLSSFENLEEDFDDADIDPEALATPKKVPSVSAQQATAERSNAEAIEKQANALPKANIINKATDNAAKQTLASTEEKRNKKPHSVPDVSTLKAAIDGHLSKTTFSNNEERDAWVIKANQIFKIVSTAIKSGISVKAYTQAEAEPLVKSLSQLKKEKDSIQEIEIAVVDSSNSNESANPLPTKTNTNESSANVTETTSKSVTDPINQNVSEITMAEEMARNADSIDRTLQYDTVIKLDTTSLTSHLFDLDDIASFERISNVKDSIGFANWITDTYTERNPNDPSKGYLVHKLFRNGDIHVYQNHLSMTGMNKNTNAKTAINYARHNGWNTIGVSGNKNYISKVQKLAHKYGIDVVPITNRMPVFGSAFANSTSSETAILNDNKSISKVKPNSNETTPVSAYLEKQQQTRVP